MTNTNQKVAIVTGGTGTLGTAICQFLLAGEYQLAIPYIFEHEITPFQLAVGNQIGSVSLIRTNITQAEDVNQLITQTLEQFGQIDVLANIAGGFLGGIPTSDLELEKWDWMMDLNLKSVFLCCKAVLPHMIQRQSGKIVNVSARAGLNGIAGLSAYSTSKAGVRILTESIAEEVKNDGVNVNAIMPSIIDTLPNRQAMPDEDHNLWVDPHEIAKVVGFLISEAAKIINGAAIPVYGRA